MGKSPGKWIKTVLFGKKSPKSNISKGRELVNKKEAVVDSNVLENGLSLDPTPKEIVKNEEELELENKESENFLEENQERERDIMGSMEPDAPLDPEKIRQKEAAIKAQAAFRGYLARRAFKALRGIIRLQALIRGHLVRRQAVVTLCCMYGIVKLQAHVRGGRIRQSNAGIEIQEKSYLFKPLDAKLGEPVGISTKISKLSANTFIHKLLAFASLITVMALRLQYVSGDPNSVLSWLERWSASYFWKPIPQPKKIRDSKSQRKQGNISNGEAQIAKSKRTTRKLPTANFEPVPVQTNPDYEKPKRNFRKIPYQVSDPEQENPQSELEKVKRNLRRIHNPVVENAVQPEVECEIETPKQHLEMATVNPCHAVSEQSIITPDDKINKEETFTISNEHDLEITPKPSINKKEESNIPNGYQESVESNPLSETTTKDRNTSHDEVKQDLGNQPETIFKNEISLMNGDSNHKDLTGNENQKPTGKSSNLTKQENGEDGVKNSPKLPSYMVTTESAKAKLRAQGSPRFGQDGVEKNSAGSRRHSLPSSTNNKINSNSPRTQRSVQAGGKGGNKSEKPSSKGGKVIQSEWRR